MGWEHPLLLRLVSLLDGETVPYEPGLVMSLDAPGKKATRNHVGMAIVGEALRAHRSDSRGRAVDWAREWLPAKNHLALYLRDELANGLWGPETLATTPHDAFYVAIHMFSRLVAVESRDAELLRLTSEHCRALGRLCATLSDPTGEVISAGTRVPLAKGGKEQKRPVHSALTAWWRYVGLEQAPKPGFMGDPMYVGLWAACKSGSITAEDMNGWQRECPGPVRLARHVTVYRWEGGHQVEIPRRGDESGLTKGSANPNGTCDWVRAEYGEGKRGASLVTFGMRWTVEPPAVPSAAQRIDMGPRIERAGA